MIKNLVQRSIMFNLCKAVNWKYCNWLARTYTLNKNIQSMKRFLGDGVALESHCSMNENHLILHNISRNKGFLGLVFVTTLRRTSHTESLRIYWFFIESVMFSSLFFHIWSAYMISALSVIYDSNLSNCWFLSELSHNHLLYARLMCTGIVCGPCVWHMNGT